MYGFLRGVMRMLVRVVLVGGLFTLAGAENLPRQGAALVCCNHASTLEPPLLPAYVDRDDSWSMAKAEYFQGSRWKAWIFTAFHSFPVVRHTADRAALRRATGILRDGGVVFLYPEGTRITTGGLHRGEPGAGFIATLSGATVHPAAVVGGRQIFPKGARLPHRAPLRLEFGRPFTIPGRRLDGSRVDHQAAADAVMLAIAEMLPEDLRGEYADLDAWRRKVGDLIQPV